MISIFKPRVTWVDWLRKGLIIFIFFILIAGYVGWQLVRPADRGVDNKQIIIPNGLNLQQVAEQLKKEDLIKSPFWFRFWVSLVNKETNIVSGYYSVPKNVNIINLTHLLTSASKVNNEIEIRLIEGWTVEQMAQYLENQQILKAKDFITTVTDSTSSKIIAKEINTPLLESWPGGSLQGYLFPDTYRIYRNSTPSDIAIKMINTFVIKFNKDWPMILKERGLTIHQAITLASIIEKEVGSPEDQRKVADIFLKRLNANIGLQADSTINYITGKSDSAVQANDLTINSPYNTYKYRGLPPGPISNPGLSAIQAVVYPQANDYWYFLTAPDGEVIYSKTYAEHLKAKAKYLR